MRAFIIFAVFIFQSVLSDGDTKCADQQFRCNDGKCIPQQWLCDGARDCADSSDEAHEACDKHSNRNSPCFGNQPECQKHGSMRCIPHEWLCDGHPDCDKGEDEANCSSVQWFRPPESLLDNYYRKLSTTSLNVADEYCRYGEFKCVSGECIKRDKVCDTKTDCKDASDETLCNKDTTSSDGKVVPTSTTMDRSTTITTTRDIPTVTTSSLPTSMSSVTPTTTSTTTKMITTVMTDTTKVLSSTQGVSTTITTTSTPKPSTITTNSKLPSSSIMTSTLVAPIISTDFTKTTPEPTTQTTQTSLKILHFTQPATTPHTSSQPTSLVKSPYLIQAIQPPSMLQKAVPALPFTPIMALLFVTASPSNTSAISNTLFKYSDTPQQISAEIVENLVRGSRSSEDVTNLKPVKFVKGVPIEPINSNNSTEYESF